MVPSISIRRAEKYGTQEWIIRNDRQSDFIDTVLVRLVSTLCRYFRISGCQHGTIPVEMATGDFDGSNRRCCRRLGFHPLVGSQSFGLLLCATLRRVAGNCLSKISLGIEVTNHLHSIERSDNLITSCFYFFASSITSLSISGTFPNFATYSSRVGTSRTLILLSWCRAMSENL